jgi:hypothetical protein
MAINDWNAQHAAAEGIVLLPVKWGTHASDAGRATSSRKPHGISTVHHQMRDAVR